MNNAGSLVSKRLNGVLHTNCPPPVPRRPHQWMRGTCFDPTPNRRPALLSGTSARHKSKHLAALLQHLEDKGYPQAQKNRGRVHERIFFFV